jgi:hypothetical protein
MPNYRMFAKEYTNSSSDYTNYKKITNSHCFSSVGPKGTSPYFCLMTCNKIDIFKCEEKDACDKAPINLEQSKSSYICGENIVDENCKEPIVLYPYGKYLCDASFCNTCP